MREGADTLIQRRIDQLVSRVMSKQIIHTGPAKEFSADPGLFRSTGRFRVTQKKVSAGTQRFCNAFFCTSERRRPENVLEDSRGDNQIELVGERVLAHVPLVEANIGQISAG